MDFLFPMRYFLLFSLTLTFTDSVKIRRVLDRINAIENKLELLEDSIRRESQYRIEDISDVLNKMSETPVGIEEGKTDDDEEEAIAGQLSHSGTVSKISNDYKRLLKAFQFEKRLNMDLKRKFITLERELINIKKKMSDEVSTLRNTLTIEASTTENAIRSLTTEIRLNMQTVQVLNETVQDNVVSIDILNESLVNTTRYVSALNATMHETCAPEKAVSKTGQDVSTNNEVPISEIEMTTIGNVRYSSCMEVPESGAYSIYPSSIPDGLTVYCDKGTPGGPWLVFLRRQDGSVDFYRYWEDFKHGFGNVSGEFWLGNEHLHKLTADGKYKLRIDLEDFDGDERYAEYEAFQIGSEEEKYKLTMGAYSGTAGDSLRYNEGKPFSTRDSTGNSCSLNWKGAWWFTSCAYAHFNGLYFSKNDNAEKPSQMWRGVRWDKWRGYSYSLKSAEMKIREMK